MSRTNRAAFAGAALAATGLVAVAAGCGSSASSGVMSQSASVAPYSTSPSTAPSATNGVAGSASATKSNGNSARPSTTATGPSSSSAGSSSTTQTSGGTVGGVSRPQGSPSRVYVLGSNGETLVNASLIPIYVDSQGVLAPPGGTAGYLANTGWALPGYKGAAILAGHITNYGKPDTFFNLTKVVPGNKIIVRYTSGQQTVFTATKSAGEPKATLNKDGSIWASSSPTPVLRLITCDPKTPVQNGHFEGNWIVWADPA